MLHKKYAMLAFALDRNCSRCFLLASCDKEVRLGDDYQLFEATDFDFSTRCFCLWQSI